MFRECGCGVCEFDVCVSFGKCFCVCFYFVVVVCVVVCCLCVCVVYVCGVCFYSVLCVCVVHVCGVCFYSLLCVCNFLCSIYQSHSVARVAVCLVTLFISAGCLGEDFVSDVISNKQQIIIRLMYTASDMIT